MAFGVEYTPGVGACKKRSQQEDLASVLEQSIFKSSSIRLNALMGSC